MMAIKRVLIEVICSLFVGAVFLYKSLHDYFVYVYMPSGICLSLNICCIFCFVS